MGKYKELSLLQYAAIKASHNKFFLAESLNEFRISRGMTDDELAKFLGCNPALLSKIALCRRPDPDSSEFRGDIERIATTFSVLPIRLVQVIREVDTLKALAEIKPIKEKAPEGLLAVARDDEDKKADDKESKGSSDEGEDAE
jgi:hypothetical protein